MSHIHVLPDIFFKFSKTILPGHEALRPIPHTVMDYKIDFRTLVADSGWNNCASSDAHH